MLHLSAVLWVPARILFPNKLSFPQIPSLKFSMEFWTASSSVRRPPLGSYFGRPELPFYTLLYLIQVICPANILELTMYQRLDSLAHCFPSLRPLSPI
jgi:hypothetical protein